MGTILDDIAERFPEALKADGFDEAIIGIAHRAGDMAVVAYDIRKCLKILETRDGMTPEGAQEFFDFNVVDAYMGRHTPVFIEVLDSGCQNQRSVGVYNETLDPTKQKRKREGGRQFYRYIWTAPDSLRAQGFNATHAMISLPSLGFLTPSAIISPFEVWFESTRRFPYNTVLQITY